MNQSNSHKLIIDGFRRARLITKENAKTFYFASRFLNKEKRKAAYSIYSICRISDDSVDIPNQSPASVNLETMRKKIDSAYSNNKLNDSVLSAFRETINKYEIPKEHFNDLLEGIYMDLSKNRYDTFDELYTYCYRVAGVVGLIMLKIFGSSGDKALQHAVDLGLAMQLTNILRDIKEDYQRGRIYIPRDEMKRFNITEKHIVEERIDKNFIALLKYQIQRARTYYVDSAKGIKMISDKKGRFVVCMMKDIYAAILDSIEKNKYDVFLQRAHVNTSGKISLLLKILLKGEYRCKLM